MPSLSELVFGFPLFIRPLPLGLIGLILLVLGFLAKTQRTRAILLLVGLVLALSPLSVLVLVGFSNM